MIKGIGIDIVKISRIKWKIASKILSTAELEQCINYNLERKMEYLAGRFAAKEALFKATGKNIDFKEISIINNEEGKPVINHPNSHVSITHDGKYACSVVIIED